MRPRTLRQRFVDLGLCAGIPENSTWFKPALPMHQASAALDELFSPTQIDDADKVLFSLPVTQRRLEQATLGLTMIAYASLP
jgi:hypothetical protein